MHQKHQGREQQRKRRADATTEAIGIAGGSSCSTRSSSAAGNPADAHARTSEGADERSASRECAATDKVNDSRANPLSEGGSGTSEGARSNDARGAKFNATHNPASKTAQEAQSSGQAGSEQRRTSTKHTSSDQGGSRQCKANSSKNASFDKSKDSSSQADATDGVVEKQNQNGTRAIRRIKLQQEKNASATGTTHLQARK